jgi:hypothetical protein
MHSKFATAPWPTQFPIQLILGLGRQGDPVQCDLLGELPCQNELS